MSTESSSILRQTSTDVDALSDYKDYPEVHTFEWMMVHASCFLVGASLFLMGSFAQFPLIYNRTITAWGYTIGSALFFITDYLDWYHPSIRVGCFNSGLYEHSYEEQVANLFAPKSTFVGYIERSEVGWNFVLNLLGSAMYLAGSVLLFPITTNGKLWINFFLVGSTAICIAQVWKLYRRGCINIEVPKEKSFRISNILKYQDLSYEGEVFCDIFTFFGGFFFLLGDVFLSPGVDVNAEYNRIGVACFLVGAVSFLTAALAKFVEDLFKFKDRTPPHQSSIR